MKRPMSPFSILLIIAVGILASCEFRERVEEEPEVEMTRVMPAPPVEARERLGPVFAPPEETPLLVGDDFWAGPRTVGYELIGRFISREALHLTLDPSQVVGLHDERTWMLSDILVAVDFRGDGDAVIWRVAGPPEVVETYVSRLEESVPRRAPITELGILPLEVQQAP